MQQGEETSMARSLSALITCYFMLDSWGLPPYFLLYLSILPGPTLAIRYVQDECLQ